MESRLAESQTVHALDASQTYPEVATILIDLALLRTVFQIYFRPFVSGFQRPTEPLDVCVKTKSQLSGLTLGGFR